MSMYTKNYQDLTEEEVQKILGMEGRTLDDYAQILYTIRSKRKSQACDYKTGSLNMMARTPINEFETQAAIIAASSIWGWMSQNGPDSRYHDHCYNTSRFSFFSLEYFQTLTMDDHMDTDPMDDKQLPLYDYSTAITSALASSFMGNLTLKEEIDCDKVHHESYALAFIFAEYTRFIAYGFACMGSFQTDEEFNRIFYFDRVSNISGVDRNWTTFDILRRLTARPVLDKFLRVVEDGNTCDVFVNKEHIPFLVKFTQQWNMAIRSWQWGLLSHLRTSPFPIKLGRRHRRMFDNTTTINEDK